MTAEVLEKSDMVEEYVRKTARSAAQHRKALDLLPSGIVHDARRMWPHGIYVDRALGPHKWDIDGNRYVDYCGGHGSMILGHLHPDVLAATQLQLAKGMHFAAGNELQVEWAQLIRELMPSVERVRFTSSGTEATHLAMRLVRAASGKPKIIRFAGNFHGWHDHVAFGVKEPLDGSPTIGVLKDVAEGIVLVQQNDVNAVEALLKSRDDIGAVMIEPLGSHSGQVPTQASVVKELRQITERHGVYLVFDEVVTGFRVSNGGLQGLYGVKPDLTALAKIVSGGMPGGAVGGRKDILDWIDFDECAKHKRERINHQGTHNANPISAAAGVATLKILKATDACERASLQCQKLRDGLNKVLDEEHIPWAVYGEYSCFNFFTNPEGHPIKATQFDHHAVPAEWFLKADKRERMLAKLVIGMLLAGVDPKSWRGGFVSATHTDADIELTINAWRSALQRLKKEGDLS